MKTKSDKPRWWRYSINHNSGTREWHYVYATRSYAVEVTEEHFDRNMPDSHKWRGARFEAARFVPRPILQRYRAHLKRTALHAASPDLEKALDDMLDLWTRSCEPRNVEFDSQVKQARAALKKARTLVRTTWFSA